MLGSSTATVPAAWSPPFMKAAHSSAPTVLIQSTLFLTLLMMVQM